MALPEGKFCEIEGGLNIHYHEVGVGPEVVFIHGSGPGASGYSNFKSNFPVFAESGYRAIVPDLVGFGYSSKPIDCEYHLKFFADSLVMFLDALGVENCVLVGNSLGGAVAIHIALHWPERISRLILMAPGGIEHIDEYRKMPGIQAMMTGFLSDTGLDHAGLKDLLKLQLYDPDILGEALDEIVDERFAVMKQQPREVLSTLSVPDQTQQLSELSCPILGFWGMNDLFCPVSGATKMLNNCQHTRFVMLTECGHWVMVEYPELFNRECLEFLNE